MILLTRRADVMGPFVNRRGTTIAASIVAALIIALNTSCSAKNVLRLTMELAPEPSAPRARCGPRASRSAASPSPGAREAF